MDPRDPDVIYASAYQRRRHVWTLLNGGPEGGIYKTTDGGESWTELERGLPSGDIGRIGLAVAPTNGNRVYAIIEAAGDDSGFYRSDNAGARWTKASGYVSASPQYYNEILVSPHDADVIYSNDTWFQRSADGGATWERINDGTMHVDNHAVWIDPDDPTHIVAGNDGGVYVSYDDTKTWNFRWNLPVTQFYKIAIDDDLPFYNIYGGTQDNNTIGGPTRTTSGNGIPNDDWFITLGGDGFEPAVEPGNPDIVYSQWQYGNLARYDRRSGEILDIQPQPTADDEPFVWNWSSALLISPHSPTRLYFGGNYLFRSEDRGESWTRISETSRDSSTATNWRSWAACGASMRSRRIAVDVDLRQRGQLRREPARGGPDLRRHRRWPDLDVARRRRHVDQGREVPRRARHELRHRAHRRPLRRPGGLRDLQQPQEGRLRALRAAQRRPWS